MRVTGLDNRLLRPILYYQVVDPSVHEPSADLRRDYCLKPGSRSVFGGPFGSRIVKVDSLGFRGPERPARKSPGIIRILCLGGSNTYGAAVSNGEDYPAQLERQLNARDPGRYQVWNAGVSAYVLSQDVATAEDDIKLLNPDVLIFLPTNTGRRAFLPGQDIEPYFEADPRRFRENLLYVPFSHSKLGLDALAYCRFYRALVVGLNRAILFAMEPPRTWLSFNKYLNRRVEPNQSQFADMPTVECVNMRLDMLVEPWLNLAALRRFISERRSRRLIIIVQGPGGFYPINPGSWKAFGVPVIDLSALLAKTAGPEYRIIHPPAHVYRWYAKMIARGLEPYLQRPCFVDGRCRGTPSD